LKRASFPLVFSSRRIAEYSVASGVVASVFHSPFSTTVATISLQRIGSPFALRTCAAASSRVSFLDAASALATLLAFGLAALVGFVVFFVLFFDMACSPVAEFRLAGPSGRRAPVTTACGHAWRDPASQFVPRDPNR
jgi:hypothetical protein